MEEEVRDLETQLEQTEKELNTRLVNHAGHISRIEGIIGETQSLKVFLKGNLITTATPQYQT